MTEAQDRFGESMGQLERLLEEAERGLPKPALEQTRLLVSAVLDVHREGLSALLDVLRDRPDGDELLGQIAGSQAAQSLLAMHELSPEPLESRARQAVRLADDAAGKVGVVELVGVEGNRVEVRIRANDGSRATAIRQLVDSALAQLAPEAELVSDVPLTSPRSPRSPSQLVPLDRLRESAGGRR